MGRGRQISAGTIMSTFDEPLPSPDSSRTKTTDGDDDNDDYESTME